MSPFARLLGVVLPACGAAGADGMPVPAPIDLARIAKRAPNAALAAPRGFSLSPNLQVPAYAVQVEQLYAALRTVAAGQRRVHLAAEYPARLQLHWVARSAVLNFPDQITAQVLALDASSSTFVLYSRSVYGYSDFGVNRQRLAVWLAAINSAVKP